MGDDISFRIKELKQRPKAVAALRKILEATAKQLESWEVERPQITEDERKELAEALNRTTTWMDEKEAEQDKVEAHETAAFTSRDVAYQLEPVQELVIKALRKRLPQPELRKRAKPEQKKKKKKSEGDDTEDTDAGATSEEEAEEATGEEDKKAEDGEGKKEAGETTDDEANPTQDADKEDEAPQKDAGDDSAADKDEL